MGSGGVCQAFAALWMPNRRELALMHPSTRGDLVGTRRRVKACLSLSHATYRRAATVSVGIRSCLPLRNHRSQPRYPCCLHQSYMRGWRHALQRYMHALPTPQQLADTLCRLIMLHVSNSIALRCTCCSDWSGPIASSMSRSHVTNTFHLLTRIKHGWMALL